MIGILAGMGPSSTGPFIDLIVKQCRQLYGARDDIDFPRMLILSQPAPFYEDRCIDHVALELAIVDGLRILEAAGADCLAIACNTAHIYYAKLAAAVQIKLLNIVTAAVDSIPQGAHRIAFIAARPTVAANIFQTTLRECGYSVCDSNWQDDVDQLLGLIRDGANLTALRSQWDCIANRARQAQGDHLLVACLDVSGVLHVDWTDMPLIDAAQSLARAIAMEWLERRGPGSRIG
jgi:aspartate racemase